MSSHNKHNGRVLQASDNKVQGASEALITTTQEKTEVVSDTKEAAPAEFDPWALLKELKTKSAVIRYIASKGKSVADIHKILKNAGFHSDKNPDEPIRYQHVRNVLTQQVKKVTTNQTPTPASETVAPSTESQPAQEGSETAA